MQKCFTPNCVLLLKALLMCRVLGFIILVVAYSGCNKPFYPTLDKPYTNDTKHYRVTVQSLHKDKFWQNEVIQFPPSLNSKNENSFVYLAGMMQGGMRMALHIDFPTQQKAELFFQKYSRGYVAEFNFESREQPGYLDSISNSDGTYMYVSVAQDRFSSYCRPEIFDSLFREYSTVRFIDTATCWSQAEEKYLGGITSCIAIDHRKKKVYCYTSDDRL